MPLRLLLLPYPPLQTRDHFCSKLDHTELGITAKISALEGLIQKNDPELGATLSALRVSPSFYGFRWLTLLMTQERMYVYI